jgi:hypothetical protein
MNNDSKYVRVFYVPIKWVQQFISFLKACNIRYIVSQFEITYDNINEHFIARITFPDGEDYVFFHNVAVQFMIGITVEN